MLAATGAAPNSMLDNAAPATRGGSAGAPDVTDARGERPSNDLSVAPSTGAGGTGSTPASQAGAAETPPSSVCSASNPVIGFDDIYAAVARDLASAPASDAAFFRYLSLANRFDATGCDSTRLAAERQALTKLVNALSSLAALTVPVAVDAQQTLFRVDERACGWNRNLRVDGETFSDVWEAVVAANPFAVPFSGVDADAASGAAGTAVPVMFSDSFLGTAALGALYYAIIGIDTNSTVDDFIRNVLGVDFPGDGADQIRAGTTQSRFVRADQLALRNPIARPSGAGVLWQIFSYDGTGNADMFATPLAAPAGDRSLMYTLPNGLFAFAAADAAGAFTTSTGSLLDPHRADLVAIASVSCSDCHATGLLPIIDEVGPASVANAQALQLDAAAIARVQALYPDASTFAQRLASDTDTFYQPALTKLELPTLGPDPVAATSIQFEAARSIAAAAGDLAISESELRANLDLLAPSLAVLGQAGATMAKSDFAGVYVDSLCRLSVALDNQPAAAACNAATAR